MSAGWASGESQSKACALPVGLLESQVKVIFTWIDKLTIESV